MNQRINFQAINNAALNDAVNVLSHYLPDGKISGREYKALNPTRGDNKEGSFSVNTHNGRWSDFATGDKGGDLVGLVAYLNGVKQGAAAEELSQFLGATPTQPHKKKPSEWLPSMPVPSDAPAAYERHTQFGKPSGRWIYRDAGGAVLFHMCRFDVAGKKRYAPLSYGHYGTESLHWSWKGLPVPRPLYGLDQLAAKPEAKVVICEGEKAADAANALLSDWVAVTPPNGAQSPDKANWSPLHGRDVMIWPDNDAAGQKFAGQVKELAIKAGVKSVTLLVVPLDFEPNGEALKPVVAGGQCANKWDAADAKAEGWQPIHLKQLISQAGSVTKLHPLPSSKKESSNTRIKKAAFGDNFKVKDNGVWFHPPAEDPQDAPKPIWICSKLVVSARTRDSHSENHGRLLEFVDADGVAHRWAMPMEMLAGDGLEVRRRLMSQGLGVAQTRKAREMLGMYLQTQSPSDKALCVDRIGWHDGVFVLPDKVLGESQNEQVLLQIPSWENTGFAQKGSLSDWKEQVAALCVGNSRLLFAASLGFAASLLEPLMEESGGFNIRGASSTGKSTALRVTCSVWGGANRMQRWRATSNGLEGVAAMHNDTVLCLDELGQVEPREAGEIAYMLANGAGKQRSRRDGSARAIKGWRLLFLSAGEVGLADHMRQGGKKVKAGQVVRMVDIPADAGQGLGLFDTLNNHTSGGHLSKALSVATQKVYGTAGEAFIKGLLSRSGDLVAITENLKKCFLDGLLPEDANGQVQRVAGRFALVAAAGELATEFKITGWPAGEAIDGTQACFKAWLKERGGHGSQEEREALQQVRHFIEVHGESRFAPWVQDDRYRNTHQRVGFRKASDSGGIEFFILIESFKRDVCEGLDWRFVAGVLKRHGWLVTDAKGGMTRPERLPDMGLQRCYRLKVPEPVEVSMAS